MYRGIFWVVGNLGILFYMDLTLFNERKIDRKNQAGYTKSKKVKRG